MEKLNESQKLLEEEKKQTQKLNTDLNMYKNNNQQIMKDYKAERKERGRLKTVADIFVKNNLMIQLNEQEMTIQQNYINERSKMILNGSIDKTNSSLSIQ